MKAVESRSLWGPRHLNTEGEGNQSRKKSLIHPLGGN